MAPEQFPVLIVGGGVVGLTASLFLAQHGVRSLLVERHPGTSIHPRARGVNGRTMELLRELGIEAEVRKLSDKIAASVGIYSGRTLVEVLAKRGEGGWLLKRIRSRGVRGQGGKKSPTGPCRCTQDDLEPLLLTTARARGVDARFHTELTAFDQDATGVTATLLDRQTAETRTVRADYLIAADGARSPSRERLGATMSGQGVLTHQLNVYFQADLASLVKGREFSMCLLQSSRNRSLLVSINNRDLWVLHISYYPDKGERPEDFPPARLVDIIREAVGLPGLAVEIKGALPWQSAVRVADRYQHGRVFLAGDAAHVMPPWGGFGANTGIQDAHNLAWKLALVLGGAATPALLATYEIERQPVARRVSDISGSMNDEQGLMSIRPGLGTLRMLWTMRKVLPYLTLGYGYTSPAIALEPGASPGPSTGELRGRPGTRAPHLWLKRRGQRISTLDLLGRGFVLLTGDGAAGDSFCAAAREAAAELGAGLRMDTFQVGREVEDPEGRWPAAYGVGRDGAVLIRPDGFVLWRARGRGQERTAAPEAELRRVLGRALRYAVS